MLMGSALTSSLRPFPSRHLCLLHDLFLLYLILQYFQGVHLSPSLPHFFSFLSDLRCLWSLYLLLLLLLLFLQLILLCGCQIEIVYDVCNVCHVHVVLLLLQCIFRRLSDDYWLLRCLQAITSFMVLRLLRIFRFAGVGDPLIDEWLLQVNRFNFGMLRFRLD